MATKTKAPRKGKAAIEKKNKALKALDITYAKVEDVIPNSYNPNRQSDKEFELLRRSMEEDGFTQPIVVVKHDKQKKKFRIVDGEHRWRCAQELGYEEVPIVVTPMSFEQAKIATLRHNRARGSEDIELSAEVLRDLREVGALDWAQDSLMMDDVELTKLLDDTSVSEALASEEFDEAWVPTTTAGDDTEEAQEYKTNDGTLSRALSKTAVEQQRKMEKDIATAKSEEERQMVVQENKFYRLNLVFSGEEGELVKSALGDEPATALLKLCKKKR